MTQLSIDQLSDIDPEPLDKSPAALQPADDRPTCVFVTRHPIDDIWAPKVPCKNPARYIIADKQCRDKKEQVRREQALERPLTDEEKVALPHSHHMAICEVCWSSRSKISDFDILEDLDAVSS